MNGAQIKNQWVFPYRDIIGFIIFVIIAVGVTCYLQASLIIFRIFGVYAHWGMILIIIPLFLGVLTRLMRPRWPELVCLMAGILSAWILFHLYRDRFWADPPHLLAAFIFAFTYIGISYSVAGRFIHQLSLIISYIYQKNNDRKPTSEEASSEDIVVEKSQASLKAFLDSPIVRFLEFVLTLLSFVIAVVGTFMMGKG